MKEGKPARRHQFRKGIYVLPNLFTTASLFCGFYGIIAAVKGFFEPSAVAILAATVLDALDGRIARMTRTTSRFGGEYDSLADLVAFGVAPAVLFYLWSLSFYGKWGWLAAFLFVTCGALRLARFNVQVGLIESKLFNGLPIPAAAMVVATGVLLYYYLGWEGQFHHLALIAGVVGLSLLMVSSIKYYSFKDLDFFSRKPFMSFVLIVLILTIVVAEPQIMIFTFAVGYSLSGPAWLLVQLTRRARTEARNGERRVVTR